MNDKGSLCVLDALRLVGRWTEKQIIIRKCEGEYTSQGLTGNRWHCQIRIIEETSFPTVGINVSEAQDLKEGLLPPLREWQVLEPESLLRIGGFSLSPTSEPVSMWSLATPFLGADLRFYLISKFWWMLLPLKVKSKHPGLLLLEGLQYYDLVSMLSLSHPHCHTAILYTTISL